MSEPKSEGLLVPQYSHSDGLTWMKRGAVSEVTKVTEAVCSHYGTILHTGAVYELRLKQAHSFACRDI